MKSAKLLFSLVAASLLAPLFHSPAGAATITVQVIGTFDYPGAASTYPQAINNNNEIAGFFTLGSSTFGFTRAANGAFTGPLMDPDATMMRTLAQGLNDSGTVCGSYGGTLDHGFFYLDGTYTTYDVPGQIDTSVTGINNAGDFVGSYFSGVPVFLGYINVGGTVTTLDISGGSYIMPQDVNSHDQVVGFYNDAVSNEGRGFYSDRNGQLHYPINGPGGKNTYLYGINDQGIMVGGYVNGNGHDRMVHGLLFVAPSQFVTVDYLGAPGVTLTGINNKGFICGYYTDPSNKTYGLLARARVSVE